MRILLLAEGDAETRDSWSGSAKSLVDALRRRGAAVRCVNLELRTWRRAWVALRSFSPNKRRWRWRYHLGGAAFRHRSARANAMLARHYGDWDAVIQIGAPVSLRADAAGNIPYVIYSDANALFARRGSPFSGLSSLDDRTIDELARREKQVYDAATRIWTMSRALAASFSSDFGQSSEKIRTIYAGPNLDTSGDEREGPGPRAAERPPSILFVGKDYERKGLRVLVEAFAQVRDQVPGATLEVVGANPAWAAQPGVVLHGFVPSATPEGANTLRRLYREATVFCLPTRYEPFGVSFVEAMLAGVPCVGTRAWAIPEIIEDGRTGWLVPQGDVAALGKALEQALRHPNESAEMGRRGRERALREFTWDRVAERALEDLGQLRDEPGAHP
jgi:glycosyltransferase involved in cell wall biosynthesis